MLSVLGSSLSPHKKVYKHVLTAPHSLQSSIWFTAVHKSQEQRAPGSLRSHLLLREGLLAVLPQPSCGCGPPKLLSCAVSTPALISQSKAVVLLKQDLPCTNQGWFFWPSSPLFEPLSEDRLQEEELHELEVHCCSCSWPFQQPGATSAFSEPAGTSPSSPWWLIHTKQPHNLICSQFHHLQVNSIWPHKHKYTQLLSEVPKLLFFHHFLPLSFPRLSWQEHHVPFLWFHTTAVIHPSAETLQFQNLS